MQITASSFPDATPPPTHLMPAFSPRGRYVFSTKLEKMVRTSARQEVRMVGQSPTWAGPGGHCSRQAAASAPHAQSPASSAVYCWVALASVPTAAMSASNGTGLWKMASPRSNALDSRQTL
jgi:hypothetical protein